MNSVTAAFHRRKRRLNAAVTEFIKLLCKDSTLAAGGNLAGGMKAAGGGNLAAGLNAGGEGNGTDHSVAGSRVGERDSGKAQPASRNGRRLPGSKRSGRVSVK